MKVLAIVFVPICREHKPQNVIRKKIKINVERIGDGLVFHVPSARTTVD